MKSIMVTYPDFQKLPKGLKQMLVASESFFFEETKTAPKQVGEDPQLAAVVSLRNERLRMGSLLHPAWKN